MKEFISKNKNLILGISIPLLIFVVVILFNNWKDKYEAKEDYKGNHIADSIKNREAKIDYLKRAGVDTAKYIDSLK